MIRPEWKDLLTVATCAPLAELIDPAIRVSRAIEPGEFGSITDDDLATLATHGLPKGVGWLTPAIGVGPSLFDGAEAVIRLGTYVSSEHQFVVYLSDGAVRKVSTAYGGYRCHVNTSLARFVDMAWRYHHIQPVLSEMLYGGPDDAPFADIDEAQAIKQFTWAWAWSADPPIDVDPRETFWFGAIWSYC